VLCSLKGAVYLLPGSTFPITPRATERPTLPDQAGQRSNLMESPTSPVARFASFVAVDSSADACWLWTGALSSQGQYPGFWLDNGFVYAHRYSYVTTFGAIPDDWHIHHICGNRRCVRPDHLEALSPEAHRALHAREWAAKRIERGDLYLKMRRAGLQMKQIAGTVGFSVETVRQCIRAAQNAAASLPIAA